MAQYDVAHAAGEAGLKYDTNPSQSESYVAEGNLPLGVAVVQGTSADQAAPPSATDTLNDFLGITHRSHALSRNRSLSGTLAISDEDAFTCITKGRLWVAVEAAVARGDRVYFRNVIAGAEVAGEFRADGDGTAQVTTVTPTAANSTEYRLQISLDDGQEFEFVTTSDASATAAEIVTALTALIVAEGRLTGLVTASGTTTLVLTGDKGVSFRAGSEDSTGTLAAALTTPLASDCILIKNAKWVVGGSSVAAVELY